MKLTLPSFAVLALAGFSLAQDTSSSSPSSSTASSSSASPSATPGPSKALNSTAPVASATVVGGNSTTNSLASNATGPGVPSSGGNATLPNTAVNGTGTGPVIQANAPVNVSVPSTDSASCSSFLATLNTDSDLQACIAPSLEVLESSAASISAFCNVTATQACPSSTIRRFLAYFSGNCSQELESSDKNVLPLYDALYFLTPMTQAVCAKDTNGNYCAANSTAATGNGGNGGAANVAQQPLGVNGLPDPDAFTTNNIPFLGANAALSEEDLCTTCTRNVLTSYFAFEASMPYPGGLASSPLLSAQNPLYSAIQTKCPADFLSSALDNAGAAPGAVSGAISFTPAKGLISLLVVAASFLSF